MIIMYGECVFSSSFYFLRLKNKYKNKLLADTVKIYVDLSFIKRLYM